MSQHVAVAMYTGQPSDSLSSGEARATSIPCQKPFPGKGRHCFPDRSEIDRGLGRQIEAILSEGSLATRHHFAPERA